MAEKKRKRLTNREKAERAEARRLCKENGLLPPDKPRLNRRKFLEETQEAWTEGINLLDPTDALHLVKAMAFMLAAPETWRVTPEQVGVAKLMRITLDFKQFYKNHEGEPVRVGDLYDTAQAVMKL